MIVLTDAWTERPKAQAVPGAMWSREAGAWVLHEPTARAAAVALQLFPHLLHEHPELEDLRSTLYRDVRPVDYATPYWEGLGSPRSWAPRVEAQLATRGWSWHDYQCSDGVYGRDVLRAHGGYYLGWDRGKGKTLETAGLIDALDCQATLVIAPNTSKQSVWQDELEFACPWLEIGVLPNDARKREYTLRYAQDCARNGVPFVLIVHYEALAVIAGKKKTRSGKTTIGDGWRKLGIEWDLKVADEGHRFANPDSLQSKAGRRVPARMRLVLSGSVFQNRYEELFGPLAFLYPDRYSSRWRDWNDRFIDYVENGYGKTAIGILPDANDRCRDELGRFMVIREKENLAIPETLLVELSPAQRQAYDELVTTCLAELEDGTRVKAAEGVAMLTKLRQVATGLDLVSNTIADSSKLDAAVDKILKRLPAGDDFVVFVWYKPAAYALRDRLAAEGIDSWIITGDVPQKDRAEIIRAFQKGERRVLIGTIATMGESVNLQRANHVIRIDRSFNPALNQQAVDRVDRQGQKREVYLTDIIAKDTADELVVLPNLANKQALRAAIFGAPAERRAA